MGRFPRNGWYLRQAKDKEWATGDGGKSISSRGGKSGKAFDLSGWWAKGNSGRENSNDRLWVKIMEGLNQNWQVVMMQTTYLQIILPRDLLWQGLICSAQAIAFHISGWHFLMSRTGMLINGIFMLPFSHSFMSFMAPWSDWALQLLKSSVGLRRKRPEEIKRQLCSREKQCVKSWHTNNQENLIFLKKKVHATHQRISVLSVWRFIVDTTSKILMAFSF